MKINTMKQTTNLTIIVPVHSVADPNFNDLLNKALMSIENNEISPEKVIIVRCGCGDVKEVLNQFDMSKYNFDLEVIENTTGKDFQRQINFAASKVTTEYFSFLEFDDEYSVNYFKNVNQYTKAYPEVDMFIPVISDFNADGTFIGHSNAEAWAMNFSSQLGLIDHDTLLEYANINPDGMVIRTQAFNEVGGYKPSIKLTFNYEFLLRYTNSGRSLMVIPKFGYKHVNMRPGSLFWEYKNSGNPEVNVQPDEARFWMETAKKEFFFKEDRNIRYEQTEQTTA